MQYQTHLTKGQPDDEAIKMIQYFEPLALELNLRGYCVFTSEGKDSRVLGHLYRRAKVKHFYAHSITGLDPPELIYFQRKNFQYYQDIGYITYELMYNKTLFNMMREKLFPPTRNCRYCCSELKEKRRGITEGCLFSFGVRKAESAKRNLNRNELEVVSHGRSGKNTIMPYDNDDNRKTFETCYLGNEKRLNPMAYWSNADIWNYSQDVKLEQCILYKEGFDRLGCIGCPMSRAKGRKQEFKRWQGFEKLYRKAFDDMYNLRVLQNKIVYQNCGAEWFEFWLNDERLSCENEYQESLFT